MQWQLVNKGQKSACFLCGLFFPQLLHAWQPCLPRLPRPGSLLVSIRTCCPRPPPRRPCRPGSAPSTGSPGDQSWTSRCRRASWTKILINFKKRFFATHKNQYWVIFLFCLFVYSFFLSLCRNEVDPLRLLHLLHDHLDQPAGTADHQTDDLATAQSDLRPTRRDFYTRERDKFYEKRKKMWHLTFMWYSKWQEPPFRVQS